jgi:hypothetical protein
LRAAKKPEALFFASGGQGTGRPTVNGLNQTILNQHDFYQAGIVR